MVEWGQGTKGALSGEFHREKVRVIHQKQRRATDEIVWLLLEKRGAELKAYFCWGLDDLSLEALVAYAHLRWTIEQFHKETKQILGLDRFEGRTWKGWHHHITMVLLAHAFIATQRAQTPTTQPRPSLRAVVKTVVLELATQRLIQEHRLPREKAKPIAATMLRGYSDW